jgi:hypothetical protein
MVQKEASHNLRMTTSAACFLGIIHIISMHCCLVTVHNLSGINNAVAGFLRCARQVHSAAAAAAAAAAEQDDC